MTLREEDVFMLPRGVGPHLRSQTESSGVVWGRPSPPDPAHAAPDGLRNGAREGVDDAEGGEGLAVLVREVGRRPPDPRPMNVPGPAG
jgi:hypothetical protein